MTGSEVEAGGGGGGVTAGAVAAAVVTTTEDKGYGGDAVGGEPLAVPFCSIAICLNSACDLSAVGLMLNVMPEPQWPFCLQ